MKGWSVSGTGIERPLTGLSVILGGASIRQTKPHHAVRQVRAGKGRAVPVPYPLRAEYGTYYLYNRFKVRDQEVQTLQAVLGGLPVNVLHKGIDIGGAS